MTQMKLFKKKFFSRNVNPVEWIFEWMHNEYIGTDKSFSILTNSVKKSIIVEIKNLWPAAITYFSNWLNA